MTNDATHLLCHVVVVTRNRGFWVRLMMLHTCLSCNCQNSKQRTLGTTNDATHLLVMLLLKLEIEDFEYD